MFHLSRIGFRLCHTVILLGLVACAGEIVEEGYYHPDSRAAEAWQDEHAGDDENPGPNAPGYSDPDAEDSLSPYIGAH